MWLNVGKKKAKDTSERANSLRQHVFVKFSPQQKQS